MQSALQQAIGSIKQKGTQMVRSAAEQPLNYLHEKFGTYTVNEQNPGGLNSPIPQPMGQTYNSPAPLVNKLRDKIMGVPQYQPVQQQQPEKWWDDNQGMKYKHFNNQKDYQDAINVFQNMTGIQRPQQQQQVKQPSNQVVGQIQKVKFTPQNNQPANIKPEVKQFLEEMVFPITRQAGIPDAVAAGQFAAEGRFSGLGANRNNFYNINAVDSNPNLAHRYDSAQAGVEAYADLLKRKYSAALSQQSPEAMLAMIQELGYAGDPSTYSQRADNGYASYADFIKNVPEYRYYLNQQ